MNTRRSPLGWLALAAITAGTFAPADGGANGGYFTTYNSNVEAGEMELMLMNDFTAPSSVRRAEGQGDYLSHMLELEYGVTSRLATEFMIETFEDTDTGSRRFTGFRWETRYRLFERPVPLNPMLYAEFEDLDPATRFKMEVSGWVRPPYAETAGEPDRERILESRLVLSQDFGPVNVAFNWINEDDVSGADTAFGYAAGVMWMIHAHGGQTTSYTCPMHSSVKQAGPGNCPDCGMALVPSRTDAGCSCKTGMPGCRCAHCAGGEAACPCGHAGGTGVGLELYGALGDTRTFGLSPARQEHYLGPVLMRHLTSRLMMHAQLAIGLTRASDNLVRVNFGYDL